MLKAYPRVIHASLISTDTCGYHAQLSMVTSNIDMISVIFIRGKLLKLHASMSIHTTGISAVWSMVHCIFGDCETAKRLTEPVLTGLFSSLWAEINNGEKQM